MARVQLFAVIFGIHAFREQRSVPTKGPGDSRMRGFVGNEKAKFPHLCINRRLPYLCWAHVQSLLGRTVFQHLFYIDGPSSRAPRPHSQLSSIRSRSPQNMLEKPSITLSTRRTLPLFSYSPQNKRFRKMFQSSGCRSH